MLAAVSVAPRENVRLLGFIPMRAISSRSLINLVDPRLHPTSAIRNWLS